jgi:ActR/RegA family two-component response regulator
MAQKEKHNEILKEAYEQYMQIKDEAYKNAKSQLAGQMSDVFESLVKKELEKQINEGLEPEVEKENEMETKSEEKEEMTENMENSATNNGEDEIDIDMDAIDEAIAELEKGEMKLGENSGMEDNSMEDVNVEELDLNELASMMDEEELDSMVGEMVEEELNIEDLDIEDDKPEVEEGLSHVNTHQNAKQVGSENNINYGKEQKLRPAMTESKSKKKVAALVESNKDLNKKLQKLMEDNRELISINEQYQDTLSKIKTQLHEMAVFNTNLAHVNSLFVENALTVNEKQKIINGFKSVKTIQESKKLYGSMINDFKKKPTITESTIEEKLNDSVSSGKSAIVENTVFQKNTNLNEKTDRMKQLFKYSGKN